MKQKHRGISYVHYTTAFALAVIAITLTVGYLLARQQARVAHEQAQTEKLLAILNTAAPLFEPFDRNVEADFPGRRDRPEDLPEMTRKLQEIAARNGMDQDDGSCLVLIGVNGEVRRTRERFEKARSGLGERSLPTNIPADQPFTANKPRGRCWRMLGHPTPSYALRKDETMVMFEPANAVAGEIQHGNYLGQETHMAIGAVALGPADEYVEWQAILSGSMAFDYEGVRVWPGFLQVLPYLVVAAIFLGGLSVFFAGHIISAIWTMVNAQKRLADGKLDYRLIKRRRRDEFGDLFGSFNAMAESLENQVRRAREGEEESEKEKDDNKAE